MPTPDPLHLDGRPITLRGATPAEIVDLRHRVLREGLPRETAIFSGDADPTTAHFAAVDQSGHVLACASFHRNALDGRPAWQLRGMATEAAHRSRGLGAALLAYAEAAVRAAGPRLLWCNARVPAVRFYVAQGWSVVSEPFDIPTAGPHVRMSKE